MWQGDKSIIMTKTAMKQMLNASHEAHDIRVIRIWFPISCDRLTGSLAWWTTFSSGREGKEKNEEDSTANDGSFFNDWKRKN